MKSNNGRSLLKVGVDSENKLIEYYRDQDGIVFKRIPRKFLNSGNSAQYIKIDNEKNT